MSETTSTTLSDPASTHLVLSFGAGGSPLPNHHLLRLHKDDWTRIHARIGENKSVEGHRIAVKTPVLLDLELHYSGPHAEGITCTIIVHIVGGKTLKSEWHVSSQRVYMLDLPHQAIAVLAFTTGAAAGKHVLYRDRPRRDFD